MVFMEGDEEKTKEMVIEALQRAAVKTKSDNSRFIRGVKELGMLITPLNVGQHDEKTRKIWGACLQEYREMHESDDSEEDATISHEKNP
jgi:hypothetical protein